MTRRQEIVTIADYFEENDMDIIWLEAGTLDGGDILQIGDYVLIGISERTDKDGATAIAEHVKKLAKTPIIVEVINRVHLKTNCSALDAATILATQEAKLSQIDGIRVLRVPEGEELAANCVAYNRNVLMPKGHKKTEELLLHHQFVPLPIDLSEFEKGGGGATCLSIRY